MAFHTEPKKTLPISVDISIFHFNQLHVVEVLHFEYKNADLWVLWRGRGPTLTLDKNENPLIVNENFLVAHFCSIQKELEKDGLCFFFVFKMF